MDCLQWKQTPAVLISQKTLTTTQSVKLKYHQSVTD